MKRRDGFTMVEIMVAASVLTLALALTLAGFGFVLRGSNQARVQNELDTEVQLAMERVKYHVRLSSLDLIYYYPAGPGPYSAFSFPMARDDDGDGAVDTDGDGDIIWDRTMVYHVWSGEPTQLRLTIFDPRDDTLNASQRQQQLDYVVVNGHGSGAPNGANTSTQVIFENLFDWEVTPRSSTVDAYSQSLRRERGETLGSCVLSNGMHTFTFTVVGKNAASSGYRVGVDSLVISPSYGEREAEAQLPATAVTGATVVAQEMLGGSWSGNHQLQFPASAVGHTFSLNMENDRWEETNFEGLGRTLSNARIEYYQGLFPKDFVVQLDGYGYSWYAYEQTAVTNEFGPVPYGYNDPDEELLGCAVRVLIKGSEMETGGWVQYSGGRSWVYFAAGGAGTNEHLRIEEAHIAECASQEVPSADIAPGTLRQLYRWGGDTASWQLSGGNGTWSYDKFANYPVDKEKTYVVSFLVSGIPGHGHARWWPEMHDASGLGCYVITNAGSADITADVWEGRPDLILTNRLYCIEYLYTSYPTNGVYTSPIYDTHLSAPSYTDIGWTAIKPANTYVGLKVRAGSNADLSDALSWSNITVMTSPGAVVLGAGRYAQFQAELRPDPSWGFSTPLLRDVTLRWQGEEQLVDISGTLTKGPDYGIFFLEVDGEELKTGLNIDLEIFRDALGYRGSRRVTSALTAEVVPRNTGR